MEPESDRIARLEERVRSLEAEIQNARQRLHVIGNMVAPVQLLTPDVDRHELQIQDLRSMVRAARWMVFLLAPLITIATAVTPLLVRSAVRDAISGK